MIKPIATIYNGHKFRSRLEARWAVFFESMNIEYLYEPEGFELSNGKWYLPDFYLPNKKYPEAGGLWIEVKGSANTINLDLLLRASEDLGDLLLLGEIPFVRPTDPDPAWLSLRPTDHGWYLRRGFSSYHKEGHPWSVGYALPSECNHPLKPAGGDEPATNSAAAYQRARQAQFEHGVKG